MSSTPTPFGIQVGYLTGLRLASLGGISTRFTVSLTMSLSTYHQTDDGPILTLSPLCPEFGLVRWDAIAETVPAMLALTFFGILHVPINVPALALNCGEDNADLDVELKLHGYSNVLAGCLGSVQNYLVYANTVFFMRSGGDSRLAGYMLAGLTFLVMTIGPSLIGFIPVMMVGTLIFDLGFELLLEAVWLSRKKLKIAEYLTVREKNPQTFSGQTYG